MIILISFFNRLIVAQLIFQRFPKYDGIRLDSLNSMLRLLREKMANAFNQIESNLSMYQFVEAIRHAQTEQEKNEIVDRFKSAKEVAPRRTYE